MPRKKLTSEQKMSVARFNAMRHGFARRLPIIPVIEDEREWRRHLKGIVKSLQPEGYFEELLVRRIAVAFWELDRLTAYQVAATMGSINGVVSSMTMAANYLSGKKEFVAADQYEVQEVQQATLLPTDGELDLIISYGAFVHRHWVQTLHELETLQARRRGEPTPLARVDISSSPNLGPKRSTAALRAVPTEPT